jgi:L-2-hydroxyglutarate oxidase LhgO
VVVLESAPVIGTGASSRNSEVVHAGIYYPKDSLKARFCVDGRRLLYAYCAQTGVAHRRCGKLIVATDESQVAQLGRINDAARANGVNDLVFLDAADARRLEPALQCLAALMSPSSGIVDSHGLMLSLQGDLERAGGVVAFASGLRSMRCLTGHFELQMLDGTVVSANSVVNAAGLWAPELARRFAGLEQRHVPKAYYAKGNYFSLSGRAPFAHLIYPVPEQAGLGVHLTLDLGGQAKFGPDVEWVDSPDDLVVDATRAEAFYAQIRRYWPALPTGALSPGYAGIRPKFQAPGEPAKDFLIQGPADHGVARLVNLFGIESPGLTSSLAIAQHVVTLL